ncbi:GINS complex subunit 4, partial [Tremellales sp. Uapishka_1]
MSSFFDDPPSSPDDLPNLPPPLPPSRFDRSISELSRGEGSGSGSRSFLSRLESASVPPSEFALGTASLLGSGREVDLEEEDESELDNVRRMGKVWVKERGTVDILSWEGDLIDSLFDKLDQQQSLLNTLRADANTSEEEHFKLMLVQTEMERIKYLVRSYVRCRLAKIERYSYYITTTPTTHHLLSGAELSHATRYTELLHTHFKHSVLDSLPEWLQKLDDKYGDGLSMSSLRRDNSGGVSSVPQTGILGSFADVGYSGERAALAKGTTHLVKYKMVDRWIQLGWAEIL